MQDLKFAFRQLLKNPGFTAVAVLTLALGIGANTAIFTVINALVLRSLHVPEPERLVRVTVWSAPVRDEGFPYGFYQRLSEHAPSHTTLAAAQRWISKRELTATGLGQTEPEAVNAQAVSGSFFPVLGVSAIVGRSLTPADDRADAPQPVAVISHAFWQRRFGANPEVIGRAIQLDTVPFTIVGVMPAGFSGIEVDGHADLWLPLQMLPQVDGDTRDLVRARPEAGEWLTVFGRLKSGVAREQARAELSTFYQQQLAAQLETRGAQWTETQRNNFLNQPLELEVAGAGTSIGRRFSRLFGILAGTAGLVLLIACANVAGLLLARGASRRREFAVRAALGARRGRLIRQLGAENLLLALLGGVFGLVFARWGTDLLAGYLPQHGRAFDLMPDGRVLLFALTASVLTGVMFGLVPALRLSRPDLATAMKDQAGQMAGGARACANHALVVGQIALSVILLAGAGLFVRTLRNLQGLDLGFKRDHLVLFDLDFPRTYDAGQQTQVNARILQLVSSLPGVRCASLSGAGLLSGNTVRTRFSVDGYTPQPDEKMQVTAVVVGPRFFETLRIPLLRGRELATADVSSPPKVVIGESMARRFFGETDPIGRIIRHGREATPFEIIGVAKDTTYQNLREKTPLEYYVPYFGGMTNIPPTFYADTTHDPSVLEANLRPIIRQVDPRVTIRDMRTMKEVIDGTIVQERAIAQLASFFSVFALILASLGLYGALSFGVVRRTREIGVRMALGASAREVLALVVRQGLTLASLGCALGLAGALALARLVASLLYNVKANDPLTFVATALVLLGIALLACWLPARRAAEVDPMEALRYE
ncbi:MAG TPA: ABC transporter permease [Candidatus Angelobacter sp.]|nr:ABC transporter permease [Candidatus Angelobacter sp.]